MPDSALGARAAQGFNASRLEALRRLEAFRPGEYARTRNHLRGAVSRLSPYITHGLLALPEVYQAVDDRHRIGPQHKFTYELAWREYFHFQWRQRGDGILESFHPGPLPEVAYLRSLPDDIREARTGIPVIDRAVAELYQTGWLHNHARMWLASYIVHIRKVHWRNGADWMYAHLIDGDLASNHLSWQWVAGTASHKPYLFNAENVARYAPRDWQSPGTVIDTEYEALDVIARTSAPWAEAMTPPPVSATPEPAVSAMPTQSLPQAEPAALAGCWLVHPWAIRMPPKGCRSVGVLFAPFHRAWPWSMRRWSFVLSAMGEICDRIVWCEVDSDQNGAWPPSVSMIADPHLAPWSQGMATMPVPRLFQWPDRSCRSFSEFWRRASVASD